MTEAQLIENIEQLLLSAKTSTGRQLFKQVIVSNIPAPDSINVYPSVAFYIAESRYIDKQNYQIVDCDVLIYTYNRHKTTGLSTRDIDSNIIKIVRTLITTGLTDTNITDASVVSTVRDGGSLFPRTIVELTANIKFVESKQCM